MAEEIVQCERQVVAMFWNFGSAASSNNSNQQQQKKRQQAGHETNEVFTGGLGQMCRADITFIVNELCQKMSSPNQQSLARLKRLAKYLKRERLWAQVFEYGKWPKSWQQSRTRTGQVARKPESHQVQAF